MRSFTSFSDGIYMQYGTLVNANERQCTLVFEGLRAKRIDRAWGVRHLRHLRHLGHLRHLTEPFETLEIWQVVAVLEAGMRSFTSLSDGI